MYQPPNGHVRAPHQDAQQQQYHQGVHNDTHDPAQAEMDLFLPRPARAFIARIGRALRPQGSIGIIPDRNGDSKTGVIFVPRKAVPIQKFGYSRGDNYNYNYNHNHNYPDDDNNMRLPRARAMRPVRNHRKHQGNNPAELEDRTRNIHAQNNSSANPPGHLSRPSKRRQKSSNSNSANPKAVILQQPVQQQQPQSSRRRHRSPSPVPRIESRPSNSVPWRSQNRTRTPPNNSNSNMESPEGERSPFPRRSRHPSPISRADRNRQLELHSQQMSGSIPASTSHDESENGNMRYKSSQQQYTPTPIAFHAREESPPYPTPPVSPVIPTSPPPQPREDTYGFYDERESLVSHVTRESRASHETYEGRQAQSQSQSPIQHLVSDKPLDIDVEYESDDDDVEVDVDAAVVDIESDTGNESSSDTDNDREDEYSKDVSEFFEAPTELRTSNAMSGSRWSEGSTITVKSDNSEHTHTNTNPVISPRVVNRRHNSINRRAWEVGKQPAWTPVTAAVTEKRSVDRTHGWVHAQPVQRAPPPKASTAKKWEYNSEIEWSSLRDFRSGHSPAVANKKNNNNNMRQGNKSGSIGIGIDTGTSWHGNNEWASLCELRVGGTRRDWQGGNQGPRDYVANHKKMLPSTWGAARNGTNGNGNSNRPGGAAARRLHTDFAPAMSIDKGDDFIEFQTKKKKKGKRRILSNVSASMFKDEDRAEKNKNIYVHQDAPAEQTDLVIPRRHKGMFESVLRRARKMGR